VPTYDITNKSHHDTISYGDKSRVISFASSFTSFIYFKDEDNLVAPPDIETGGYWENDWYNPGNYGNNSLGGPGREDPKNPTSPRFSIM